MKTRSYEKDARRTGLKCPACGAEAVRASAVYCLICGKHLREDYQPLDTLRSSYRLQGRSFLLENKRNEEPRHLFAVNRNTVSEMAWACFVYSLVPYLGILFVPFTILIGTAGIGVFLRRPSLGGGKLAGVSIGLSVVVFGVQVFLWWLLYIIPELAGRV
ncbi:MAG TPA: hypothetical protein VMM38_04710 [Aridibacter sp.]|nr:hypothetical protein [Aridibacter sp.]